MIGPVCWASRQGRQKEWYFTIASCGKDKQFRNDMIVTGASQSLGEEIRAGVTMAFLACRPLVVHDTDDELYMAKVCETLWPGERISRIRAEIEAERY